MESERWVANPLRILAGVAGLACACLLVANSNYAPQFSRQWDPIGEAYGHELLQTVQDQQAMTQELVPAPPVAATMQVVMAGTVAAFTAPVQAKVKADMAVAAGVLATEITMTIAAGSVIATVIMPVGGASLMQAKINGGSVNSFGGVAVSSSSCTGCTLVPPVQAPRPTKVKVFTIMLRGDIDKYQKTYTPGVLASLAAVAKCPVAWLKVIRHATGARDEKFKDTIVLEVEIPEGDYYKKIDDAFHSKDGFTGPNLKVAGAPPNVFTIHMITDNGFVEGWYKVSTGGRVAIWIVTTLLSLCCLCCCIGGIVKMLC